MTATRYGRRSPNTIACAISGARVSALSTRAGEIMSPPEFLMKSRLRSVMRR